MIVQIGIHVLIADGWDVRVLKFHNKDAARNWAYGAGLPRVSKANAKKLIGAVRMESVLGMSVEEAASIPFA